jgi:hypothetical protein
MTQLNTLVTCAYKGRLEGFNKILTVKRKWLLGDSEVKVVDILQHVGVNAERLLSNRKAFLSGIIF